VSYEEGIHPNYVAARISCSCGNVIETRSTRGDFRVDICSNCHPFFTGKQKLIDAEGRVDRFNKSTAVRLKLNGAFRVREAR